MALLRLNSTNLNLDVLVGVSESYKPSREIKNLVKKVDALKEETKNFLKDNFDADTIAEAAKEISNDKNKQNQWKSFLKDVYAEKFTVIVDKIEVINKKLCGNYDEFIEQLEEK
jgi:hypothetical protein